MTHLVVVLLTILASFTMALPILVCVIIIAALKKHTIPAPNEVTTQLAGVSAVEQVNQTRFVPLTKNSHWYRHTFERPRKRR